MVSRSYTRSWTPTDWALVTHFRVVFTTPASDGVNRVCTKLGQACLVPNPPAASALFFNMVGATGTPSVRFKSGAGAPGVGKSLQGVVGRIWRRNQRMLF